MAYPVVAVVGGAFAGPSMWLVVVAGFGAAGLLVYARSVGVHDERFDTDVPDYGSWTFPYKPLMIAVMFTFASFFIRQMIPNSSSALSRVGGGVVAFRVFSLVMMCNICYRFHVPPLWLFGVMRISMIAAEGTARTHISHVYAKLGVHSREEAVARLYEVE